MEMINCYTKIIREITKSKNAWLGLYKRKSIHDNWVKKKIIREKSYKKKSSKMIIEKKEILIELYKRKIIRED